MTWLQKLLDQLDGRPFSLRPREARGAQKSSPASDIERTADRRLACVLLSRAAFRQGAR
jgi:hypothetical protein